MDQNHTRYNARLDEARRARREARLNPELATNYEPVNLDLTPTDEPIRVNPVLTTNYEPVNLVEEENGFNIDSYTTLEPANTEESVEGDGYEIPDDVGIANGVVNWINRRVYENVSNAA